MMHCLSWNFVLNVFGCDELMIHSVNGFFVPVSCSEVPHYLQATSILIMNHDDIIRENFFIHFRSHYARL
jgi:hypothetical protein